MNGLAEDRRVFRSIAWGFHAPGGTVLWWLIQPTGHLHILRELSFEQLDEQDLASAIKTHDQQIGLGKDDQGQYRKLGLASVAYTVATPAIVTNYRQRKPGLRGETVGDRLLRYGIAAIAADDDALNGWKRCQSLLTLDDRQRPWLTIDPTCTHLTDAIRAGLQDQKDTDDIQNPAPALTAFRYGAMSRPTPRTVTPTIKIPAGSPADVMRQIRARFAGNRQFGEAR